MSETVLFNRIHKRAKPTPVWSS